MENSLPDIPPKRYFTIGEVSELCGVKPYVLRYWEQEFTQLRPMKRRGNRRYYQHHEVLLIRRIRDLLYEKGFTISGARNRLAELGSSAIKDAILLEAQQAHELASGAGGGMNDADWLDPADEAGEGDPGGESDQARAVSASRGAVVFDLAHPTGQAALRAELLVIRDLLKGL
jgi:DNA-binding transcriptional MerR regulator